MCQFFRGKAEISQMHQGFTRFRRRVNHIYHMPAFQAICNNLLILPHQSSTCARCNPKIAMLQV